MLPQVVPSVTSDLARELFHESREMGVALVIVTVKVLGKPQTQNIKFHSFTDDQLIAYFYVIKQEHAEFYAQMMTLHGLRTAIEED